MRRKTATISILGAGALALGGGTLAVGGGHGVIFDDGHPVKPGSLDDGKDLLPQTKITLGQANAAAQQAAHGQLRHVVTATSRTRLVDGVSCTVAHDVVYKHGQVVERTDDWYAQDKQGAVWY